MLFMMLSVHTHIFISGTYRSLDKREALTIEALTLARRGLAGHNYSLDTRERNRARYLIFNRPGRRRMARLKGEEYALALYPV